jgi:selenocysteine lyase/cysteine desulfurase
MSHRERQPRGHMRPARRERADTPLVAVSQGQIAARLRAADIHIMCHAGRLRIAIHGYNTYSDIERLLRELRVAVQ